MIVGIPIFVSWWLKLIRALLIQSKRLCELEITSSTSHSTREIGKEVRERQYQMIAKNWPTELKKMSDSQSVIFRRRSRNRTSLLEQGAEKLSQSMKSLFEEISSSSDNLSIIG